MNKSLKNKIASLINVNRRDSAIFTPYNPTHIAISSYVDNNEVLDFFKGIIERIKIDLSINLETITKLLSATQDIDELLVIVEKYNIPIPATKLSLLNQDFAKNKDEVIKIALKYLKNLKIKFLTLQRNAQQILKFNGSWNLYLVRYFLKGLTPYKVQAIKAPLLLFQVELIDDNGTLYIQKKEEKQLNEKLIVFLQREVEHQDKLISEYDKTPKEITYLKNDIETILDRKIMIQGDGQNLRFLKETSTTVTSNYKELVIDDSVCLGIFEPSGGRLKDDLEHIINSDSNRDVFDTSPVTSVEKIKWEEINENPIIQIDKLDVYQKYAVRVALKDNTVIYGPPGTGKSEVISNIIANIMFDNKDVMMVSEKVAALEVLKKRMKSLNVFMLLIYDINDKKSFFDSIVKLANFLGNSWISNSYVDYDEQDKLEKLNQTLLQVKDFKNLIHKFDLLQKFEINGKSFLDFLKEIDKIGGLLFITELINLQVVKKINDFVNQNNLSFLDFFNQLNLFVNFIEKYQLNNLENYRSFLTEITSLKKMLDDFKIDANDDYVISSCLSNFEKLNDFLSINPNYQKILRNNPAKFYEDVEEYKKIKNTCIGLINGQFFNDVNQSILKIRPFFNIYNNAKEADKKFILDNFRQNLEIVSKKPMSKLFTSSKLSSEDTVVLECLKKLDSLNLQEYVDFNQVIQNQDLFNPLSILYFFNKKIANEQYLEFIKHKFYLFDLTFFNFQKKFNLDFEKYNVINSLITHFKIYQEKFPEFISNELFQSFFKKYQEINWNNISELLALILKSKILSKLTKLNPEDKKFVESAINVANSSKSKEIYEYLSKYAIALKHLFPIWVSRPEQVSIFIPLQKNFFEYGIYDEASQMFLERAYPLLFRSKINIVAGDDKQLKPSSFFISRNNEDEDEYEIDDLDVQESLLDRAKTTSWNVVMLQNHYRSESKDLIEFSSQFIYNNNLNYASKNGKYLSPGIEVINSNGYFIDNRNEKEAVDVISTVESNLDKYQSILIITFNITQASYIESMLMDKNYTSSKIVEKFMNQEIDVVNLENVQGNEADLVILSIGYGKKSQSERLRNNFGPVMQSGGKNRLNVAITRAKSKMIIIKSLNAAEIIDNKNEDLQIFKKFIAFLDQIELENKMNNQIKNQFHQFDSSFEEEIFNSLKPFVFSQNLNLLTQFEVGNKKIDIVVTTKDFQKVVLGIEVDGWKYHNGAVKLYEDFERQMFLEARGYPIFRVLEHEWKINQKLVIDKIILEISKYINF